MYRIFILFIFFVMIGCSAEPNKIDIDRVVKHFLELRFQSRIDSNLKKYSDYELFQLSCTNMRVKCNKVLNILEKEKPEFYKLITQSKDSQ